MRGPGGAPPAAPPPPAPAARPPHAATSTAAPPPPWPDSSRLDAAAARLAPAALRGPDGHISYDPGPDFQQVYGAHVLEHGAAEHVLEYYGEAVGPWLDELVETWGWPALEADDPAEVLHQRLTRPPQAVLSGLARLLAIDDQGFDGQRPPAALFAQVLGAQRAFDVELADLEARLARLAGPRPTVTVLELRTRLRWIRHAFLDRLTSEEPRPPLADPLEDLAPLLASLEAAPSGRNAARRASLLDQLLRKWPGSLDEDGCRALRAVEVRLAAATPRLPQAQVVAVPQLQTLPANLRNCQPWPRPASEARGVARALLGVLAGSVRAHEDPQRAAPQSYEHAVRDVYVVRKTWVESPLAPSPLGVEVGCELLRLDQRLFRVDPESFRRHRKISAPGTAAAQWPPPPAAWLEACPEVGPSGEGLR